MDAEEDYERVINVLTHIPGSTEEHNEVVREILKAPVIEDNDIKMIRILVH